jgi:hypothetical protein
MLAKSPQNLPKIPPKSPQNPLKIERGFMKKVPFEV